MTPAATAWRLVRQFFVGKGIPPGKATHRRQIIFIENNSAEYPAGGP
jgi:hypothetical protein